MTSVRVIGGGRAGSSFASALAGAGWEVAPVLGRGDVLAGAAVGIDVVLIAVPDAAIAEVAASIDPVATTVVAHVSGSLGLAPLAGHERQAVVHPLVALPAVAGGARRLVGAWYGVAADGDPAARAVVEALHGQVLAVAEADWVRYHAAAVIAANHLVALLGQVERVAGSIGAPLEAYLALARGSLDDVAALGPAGALTGPVRRGDLATVARHLDALPAEERSAYEALSAEAARLCP
ncbi:MAG: DUF2520 domain-containing protein [Acidimicrobiales bacterium]|nr:DUF2520 domain-containing protein [Acidimicrobiales bacterium]